MAFFFINSNLFGSMFFKHDSFILTDRLDKVRTKPKTEKMKTRNQRYRKTNNQNT